MPGLSYTIDKSFLDNIDLQSQDLAKSLLVNLPLQEMVAIYVGEKTLDPVEYDIRHPEKLNFIIQKVILTKLTYFNTDHLAKPHLRFLAWLAADILSQGASQKISLNHLISKTQYSHVTFSNWLKKLQQNLMKTDRQREIEKFARRIS